ncbi:hypothetical protein ACQ4M4_17575 [Leptolyngbya sp. AN02str]|uniref:hypothetical protein n=1 Tax=Leptolyngbya sp. AN02str TaxID=3423363 RepID=UPI003D31AD41
MKLPASWKLPDTIKSRFGQRSLGKQRAMVADGHLLLVLHQAPQAGDRTRQGVLFWRKPDGIWEHSGGSKGLQPLIKHLEAYNQAEEHLRDRYEQAQEAEDYFDVLEAIAPLHLAAQNIHNTLQVARDAIPGDRDLIDLRDWAYEIDRSLVLLHENTKNALEYRIAQRAEEQTRLSLEAVQSSHRLNILAAVFFPLTAISCIFGMNIASGLERSSFYTFWLITLLGVAAGVLVRKWVVGGK